MKTLLYVPFVSQYSTPRDDDGLSRACGMACVKKVIDFYQGESQSLSDYMKEGKMIKGAFIPGIGWNHKGLVAILRNHEVGAYSEEFRSVFNDINSGETLPSIYELDHVERGIRKISREVREGRPVIVSGIKQWKEKDKYHDMIILGVEKKRNNILGFYYHDPDDEDIDGRNKFVNIETFRNNWRKFAIFISE
ncbi:MAG: C39 family peptidase [bacterium]|nr:C39 family peptidase [bacterium]